MKPQDHSRYGVVLLNQTFTPLFVNTEAHAVFSWVVRKTNSKLSDKTLTRSGLQKFVKTLARELFEVNRFGPHRRSDQPITRSKVVKVFDRQFQIHGGVCVIADGLYCLMKIRYVTSRGFTQPRMKNVVDTHTGLTQREHQVVELLAQGYTNRGIAERMTISIHTVKDHLKAIRAKTGAKNRTQILRKLCMT